MVRKLLGRNISPPAKKREPDWRDLVNDAVAELQRQPNSAKPEAPKIIPLPDRPDYRTPQLGYAGNNA